MVTPRCIDSSTTVVDRQARVHSTLDSSSTRMMCRCADVPMCAGREQRGLHVHTVLALRIWTRTEGADDAIHQRVLPPGYSPRYRDCCVDTADEAEDLHTFADALECYCEYGDSLHMLTLMAHPRRSPLCVVPRYTAATIMSGIIRGLLSTPCRVLMASSGRCPARPSSMS